MEQLKQSPRPKQETMDFPTALKLVIGGAKITKLEWHNTETYGCLTNGFLMIKKDDGFHQWMLSEGDLIGKDYVVYNLPIIRPN